MKKLIPKDLLASQRGHVLDSRQATDELRQILSYPDELQGFDDLLNAIGANRSNYMQSGNQQKLINAVSNGDWVLVKPRVDPDNGGASWNGFKTKPEPPPAQHLVEDHDFTLPNPVESGFHIIQHPMSLDALERSLYEKVETFGVGGVVCALIVAGSTASLVGNGAGHEAEILGEALYEFTTQ